MTKLYQNLTMYQGETPVITVRLMESGDEFGGTAPLVLTTGSELTWTLTATLIDELLCPYRELVLTKTSEDGIIIINDGSAEGAKYSELGILLEKEDTEELLGDYHQELSLVEPGAGESVLLTGTVEICESDWLKVVP